MFKYRELLLFDPNFIIKLLHINVNNNYFEFATLIFHQISGTAMGAAFSPTIANIFLSVIIRRFLETQNHTPLLLTRYIDDIFMVWTHDTDSLNVFLQQLNKFHPSLSFTHQYSPDSVDFLDLTIFRDSNTNRLQTKTFQKSQNLYQYLHFDSYHPKSVFKALIIGECTRYVRTNSLEINYQHMVQYFKQRLIQRNYPKKLVDSTTCLVKYTHRERYLAQEKSARHPLPIRPVFKCIPPPQFSQLKEIILNSYSKLQSTVSPPRFVALKHTTLRQALVKAKIVPTDEQLIDIALSFNLDQHPRTSQDNQTITPLPILKDTQPMIQACNNSKCATCKYHLTAHSTFICSKTKMSYPIRHHFSCKSRNIIYLITCTKCKKQYVGLTTQQLNTRINHHRTNIRNKKDIYIYVTTSTSQTTQ